MEDNIQELLREQGYTSIDKLIRDRLKFVEKEFKRELDKRIDLIINKHGSSIEFAQWGAVKEKILKIKQEETPPQKECKR